MASGIYAIIHRDSGRWYAGQSINIKSRWQGHRQALRKGKHSNARLQRAWNKYGEDAFDFVVLILAPVHLLNDLEQAYLDDPETSAFNIAKCAEASARGLIFTPETRAKMSAAKKGRKRGPMSEETRAKLSESMSGRKRGPLTEEHRAKIGAKSKGRRHSEEYKSSLRGRKISDETRRRMSAAHRGKKQSTQSVQKRTETRRAKSGSSQKKPA